MQAVLLEPDAASIDMSQAGNTKQQGLRLL